MIRQMATAKDLLRFNDLGRLVTPVFLSFFLDLFLYRLSTFSENMKKIHRLEV